MQVILGNEKICEVYNRFLGGRLTDDDWFEGRFEMHGGLTSRFDFAGDGLVNLLACLQIANIREYEQGYLTAAMYCKEAPNSPNIITYYTMKLDYRNETPLQDWRFK